MKKVMKRIAVIFIGIALLSVMVTPAMAADAWMSDSNITSGLKAVEYASVPTVFYKDATWYLIAGENDGTFTGFQWTGSAWKSDRAIVSGLGDVGSASRPVVFNKSGTWYLISGQGSGGFYGFQWTGRGWESDSAIISGLGDVGEWSSPTVFNKSGTWYLISGEYHEVFNGYNWTGSEWQSDSAIVSGLGDVGRISTPEVFNKDGAWYLIAGNQYGAFYGYRWTGSAWQSYPAIVSGLGSVGELTVPAVFCKDGTWYLISGEYYGGFYGWHQVKTADLTPTAITAPELFVNLPGTITATIANVGVLGASAFNVSLSANGTVVGTASVTSLSAGNSTNMSFEWTPTSVADQELCVVADSDNAIDEVYEANNKLCITVTVSAPDLTTATITVPELFVNQPGAITATIANIGTFDASAFNVSLSADGNVVDTADVPSLSAGNTTNVSFVWTPTSAGDIELCVVADTDNKIPELDETNNKMCIGVEIKPDLTTTEITTPELLLLNRSSVINATIANTGNADAGSFNVALSANSAVVDTVSVASLGVGNSTDVSFEWTPASGGDHELCVVADPDNTIVELDETNNKNCTAVTVRSPSIEVNKTVWDPISQTWVEEITAKVGDTLRFRCSTTNSGPLNLANITVSDILSDSLEYRNSATVDGVPQEPVEVGPNEYEWHFTGPLEPSQAITIEFDATTVKIGTDTNVQHASAWCEQTEEWVTAQDSVTITVPTLGWQHGALIPWDAERLSTGNTLIAEYGNHTVIEVTPAGETVWQYGNGTAGSGANQLNSPADAERLDSGNTLIVDRNNHRVIEVNTAGDIVWQYGTTEVSGNGTNELYNPMDVEPLDSGNMLIADRLNNRVIEVDKDKTIVWEMTGLNHPFDADRLDNGNTLIVEYKNHRVIEITPAGEIVWQYGTGTPGSGVNELNYPADAERLSSGNTQIVDAVNDRVIEVRTSDYDPAKGYNGFTVDSIVWEYESNYPLDAERLSNNYTLISEAGNNRVIEVFTPAPKPKELKPLTPILISGYVNDVFGLVNDPIVIITNLNTSEVFTAETIGNSSYYQVLTSSEHVCCAGNALHFNVSDNSGNKNITIHVVTEADLNAGGFEQDITVLIPYTDMVVTAINSYHNDTRCPAWFNLSNEVDVTIENTGTTPASGSNVSLYIDGEFFGKLPVPGLNSEESATVTFKNWMPIGEDCLQAPCEFELSYKDYSFTAVADCDNDVDEHDEANNETTVVDSACYNGYTGDDPLENVAHGMLNGGVLFTTGDSQYTGLYSLGSSVDAHYDITLPEGAGVELAHLNVYYTWHYVMDTCPQMEVSITNATGTYILPLEKAYNDHKCTCPGAAWVFPWGNYVYDLTDYIQGSGSYTVTVTRNVGPTVCVAARGINLVYEDQNAPLIEYWINEGADVLIGGRRSDGGYLAWWECINNATFHASTETGVVVNATLGVVSPWAGTSWDPGMTNYLFFNDVKVGTGVYHGYSDPYSETIDGITMHIGGSDGQVGVNVTSVTDLYLNASDNVVGQCDDGDNMMPCNAFLVVEYGPPTTNEPPVADAGPDQTALVNETVTFNGSGSSDPDGTIVSYEWDFGDGTNGTGETTTCAYATAGTYTVTLTVTDDEGATGTDTALVLVNATVPNEPPVADAGPDQTALVNETVTFNGSGSSDPDGTIVSYEWDFGDGTNGTGETTTYAYATPGTYTVTLTVTDNEGATGTDTASVNVVAEGIIQAGVTLSPKKIDLNSSGVLKAYITLPEGYNATVEDINVSKVECEGADVFGFGKVIPGKQALEVMFKIQNLTVPTGPEVLLTVTGELYDGTPFEGSNTVEVV